MTDHYDTYDAHRGSPTDYSHATGCSACGHGHRAHESYHDTSREKLVLGALAVAGAVAYARR